MKKNNFFYIILLLLTHDFLCLNVWGANSLCMNDRQTQQDTVRLQFNKLVESVQEEDEFDRSLLVGNIPDSVLELIPINNHLYSKFVFDVNGYKIIRVNSNGKLSGDIFLFSFSNDGVFRDFIRFTRYGLFNSKSIHEPKELIVQENNENFIFQIIKTENEGIEIMPLFKEPNIIWLNTFKLNNLGKFNEVY